MDPGPALQGLIDRWSELAPADRRRLCRRLRQLGLSYGEIASIVPVPKGTLSGWVADVDLSEPAKAAIRRRTTQKGISRNTQWRRTQEIDELKRMARMRASELSVEPMWHAGLLLYWGEGAKTGRRLMVANSDARLLRLFQRWTIEYLASDAQFTASVNLHGDNDASAAVAHWSNELEIAQACFTKTYVKPDGTGHRKNRIENGVCRLVVRRSANAWIEAMEWIEWYGDRGWCAPAEQH